MFRPALLICLATLLGCSSKSNPEAVCAHTADLYLEQQFGTTSPDRSKFGSDEDFRKFQEHVEQGHRDCLATVNQLSEIMAAEGRSTEFAVKMKCMAQAKSLDAVTGLCDFSTR